MSERTREQLRERLMVSRAVARSASQNAVIAVRAKDDAALSVALANLGEADTAYEAARAAYEDRETTVE